MPSAKKNHTPDLFDPSRVAAPPEQNTAHPTSSVGSSQEPFQRQPLSHVATGDNERFLADIDVAQRYGVVRQTVWRWAKTHPTFPRPLNISPGTSRWKLSELVQFETQFDTEGDEAGDGS